MNFEQKLLSVIQWFFSNQLKVVFILNNTLHSVTFVLLSTEDSTMSYLLSFKCSLEIYVVDDLL